MDCLVQRKTKVLWNKLAAKVYIYCPLHFKDSYKHLYILVYHTLDVVNWDEIETVTMHIINASLESRDTKPPEWSIVIEDCDQQ